MIDIKTQTVYLMRGLPGSGKSTLAKKFVKKNGGKLKRINNDDLRYMVDCGYYNSDNEKVIKEMVTTFINLFLLNGYSVIVDNLNLAERNYRRIEMIVNKFNKGKADKNKVSLKCIDVKSDLTTCLERNSKRKDGERVPFNVICGLHNRFISESNEKNDIVEVSNDNIDFSKKQYVGLSESNMVLCLEGTVITEYKIKK